MEIAEFNFGSVQFLNLSKSLENLQKLRIQVRSRVVKEQIFRWLAQMWSTEILYFFWRLL